MTQVIDPSDNHRALIESTPSNLVNVGHPQPPSYTQPIPVNQAGPAQQFQPMYYNPQRIMSDQRNGVQQYPPNILNAQTFQAAPPMVVNETFIRHTKHHLCMGIFFIVIGIITCVIDPLVPIVTGYIYSIFISGVFLIISGAISISGAIKRNKCSLVKAMVFDVLGYPYMVLITSQL